MQKRVVLILFLISYAFAGIGQIINITSFFRASEANGKTLLSWQIVAGSTCNGIQIYRGTDSTKLIQVGEIFGVCGSVTEPVDYSFLDDKLTENTTYYYRLEFGTQGFSEIIAINIEGIFSGTSQVRPNPITLQGKIFFSKPSNEQYTLTIYNQFGQKLDEQTSNEDFFNVNTLELENGIYTYTISSEKDVIVTNSKLLVQH